MPSYCVAVTRSQCSEMCPSIYAGPDERYLIISFLQCPAEVLYGDLLIYASYLNNLGSIIAIH